MRIPENTGIVLFGYTDQSPGMFMPDCEEVEVDRCSALYRVMRQPAVYLVALAAFAITLLSPLNAQAQEATAPLTIVDAAEERFELTGEDFAGLPWTTLVTHTVWTEGPHRFEGVLLRDVLAAARIDTATLDGRSVEALALNDYQISIPATDAVDYDVLVARLMNGEPMTRRDKGPYWIVYPRDQNPELADSRYDHRWVWQLRELRLR